VVPFVVHPSWENKLSYVYYWHILGGTEGNTKGLTDNIYSGQNLTFKSCQKHVSVLNVVTLIYRVFHNVVRDYKHYNKKTKDLP
jgi:hypothetical protein